MIFVDRRLYHGLTMLLLLEGDTCTCIVHLPAPNTFWKRDIDLISKGNLHNDRNAICVHKEGECLLRENRNDECSSISGGKFHTLNNSSWIFVVMASIVLAYLIRQGDRRNDCTRHYSRDITPFL